MYGTEIVLLSALALNLRFHGLELLIAFALLYILFQTLHPLGWTKEEQEEATEEVPAAEPVSVDDLSPNVGPGVGPGVPQAPKSTVARYVNSMAADFYMTSHRRDPYLVSRY